MLYYGMLATLSFYPGLRGLSFERLSGIKSFTFFFEHLKYNLEHYSNVIQISKKKKVYFKALCFDHMIVGVK